MITIPQRSAWARTTSRPAFALGLLILGVVFYVNEHTWDASTFVASLEVVDDQPQDLLITKLADVAIGAIHSKSGRTPVIVSEELVMKMKPGSVIIDVSIDQGGCVETSRPTTLLDPTFVVHDVVHYCVPNMTANVPRDASRASASARRMRRAREAESPR